MTSLLEVGPGVAPAINFIQRVSADRVVFVGEPDNTISYAGIYDEPRFVVSNLGLLRYVRDIAIPSDEKFDWVVASNVLNSPGTGLTPYSLASAIKSVISSRSELRIENTADMFEDSYMWKYKAEVERAGYRVRIYREDNPDEFIHQAMIAPLVKVLG